MGFHPCSEEDRLFALPSAVRGSVPSRDRRGGSGGGPVPFPQQLLFPHTSLAPRGRLSQDSCGSTGEVRVEEPECEFTSCRGPTDFCVLLLAHVQTLPIY